MSNKFAVVENHLIVNVTLADESFGLAQGWIPCPLEAGIGWAFIDNQFIAPVIDLSEPLVETQQAVELVTDPVPTLAELLQQVNDLQSKILLLSGQNGA